MTDTQAAASVPQKMANIRQMSAQIEEKRREQRKRKEDRTKSNLELAQDIQRLEEQRAELQSTLPKLKAV